MKLLIYMFIILTLLQCNNEHSKHKEKIDSQNQFLNSIDREIVSEEINLKSEFPKFIKTEYYASSKRGLTVISDIDSEKKLRILGHLQYAEKVIHGGSE
ncbi:MAG: hypothetical protein KDK45_14220, partial [Leptospiraceae bacterium]|nr:hypothetical protein [Leptospiraceae bacterium]